MTQTAHERPSAPPPPRRPRVPRDPKLLLTIGALVLVVLLGAVYVRLIATGDEGGTQPAPTASGSPSASASPSSGGSGAPAPSGPLAWAPPQLTDPETVRVTADDRSLKLDLDRDYVIEMPSEPLSANGGLSIYGGHNVVLIGGEIDVQPKDAEGDGSNRGLLLRRQTGTVHVEGLRITGAGLGEGIDLDQDRGAVVQLENIRVDTVQGTRESNHADVIQTWNGPAELRVDGLTGATSYQGFFLLPMQRGDTEPRGFDLRRVDLVGDDDSGYLLWKGEGDFPISLQDVWVSRGGQDEERDQLFWPKSGSSSAVWDDVRVGTPPGGDFVPEGAAGLGYTSPGYQQG